MSETVNGSQRLGRTLIVIGLLLCQCTAAAWLGHLTTVTQRLEASNRELQTANQVYKEDLANLRLRLFGPAAVSLNGGH